MNISEKLPAPIGFNETHAKIGSDLVSRVIALLKRGDGKIMAQGQSDSYYGFEERIKLDIGKDAKIEIALTTVRE